MTATEDALKYQQQRLRPYIWRLRPLKRVFQQEVLNRLSKEILAGKINDGDRITLDYEEADWFSDQLNITFIFSYITPLKFL